jgi:hypothetical protein
MATKTGQVFDDFRILIIPEGKAIANLLQHPLHLPYIIV